MSIFYFELVRLQRTTRQLNFNHTKFQVFTFILFSFKL